MATIEKTQQETSVLEAVAINNEIVLFNDDVNTFDHVIDTLIRVCKHTSEQAEQCAMIIHFQGKYAVKNGEFDTLRAMRDAIAERNINATIEEVATK